MLEGLATWFLNNYLGKYLENLDTDQLSISLLAGQVELENVPLRKDALRFIEPAIEVRAGVVGHIKLTIPVSRMRSEPWTLLLEKVSIVLGPQKFSQYDEEADDLVRLETKLTALDGIEGDWRAAHDSETGGTSSGYYPVTSSWLSYGTSYIGTIVENLQLDIRDVHVRYEDDVTNSHQTTAMGLTLESLAAQTCDQFWSPKFVHRDPAQGQMDAFKIVSLTNMAAYLDCHAERFSDLKPTDLARVMSVSTTSSTPSSPIQYILSPVSATATLKRHCLGRPLNSRKQARVVADLQLDTLQLGLSDLQFRRSIEAVRSVIQLKRARRFWRWRPVVEVGGNCRRWWQYAITCTLDMVTTKRRASTWDTVITSARDNILYVKAFMAQLENPTTVTDEMKVVRDAQDTNRTYEELKALREIAVFWMQKKISETSLITPTPVASPTEPEPGGEEQTSPTLQRWFPLWGGWYDSEIKTEAPVRPPEIEEYLKDALKEDNEVFGIAHKDVVFSHMSVQLRQASIKLMRSKSNSSEGQLLFDFEFQNVKVEHESRPRTSSYMFSLRVGAVYLRDKITTNSLFPLLISPQSSEDAPLYPKSSQYRFTGFAKSIQSFLPTSLGAPKEEEEPLLDFLYEKKPFSSRADHRVHVKSQPLDIVYNPIVVKVVSEFFKIPEETNTSSRLSEKIRSAALNRIQEAKQRTKEEFTRNINQILEGNFLDRKLWDIMLDLSAPKLLIPDHFEDRNAPLIVIDFGKLMLTNKNASKSDTKSSGRFKPSDATTTEEDDEDDLFLTPASTPGMEQEINFTFPEKGEEVLCSAEGQYLDGSGDTEALLYNKMYDKYAVDFNNMQIIVGQVKDNWKGAHLKGNSSLHVVDRFSISLQVERRTVETPDPAWPSVVISATLPRLQLHFNEDKVVTLKHMVARLLGSEYGGRKEAITQTVETDFTGLEPADETLALFSEWQPSSGADVSSKLLVAHFCVSDLSVELQSQGKPVAEVQVTNMKAGLTRRPYDTNLAMSVHSLLLVDALQTFGPDYELLVASHKHVTVDSVSGSLRGSDPTSPASPGSPDPTFSPPPTQGDISRALSSIDPAGYSPKSNGSSPPTLRYSSPNSVLPTDILDPAALISIDVMLVSPNCPTLEEEDELKIVNIQFNSLDVIANQETIIELIGFVRRVFPAEQTAFQSVYSQPSLLTDEASCQTEVNMDSFAETQDTSNLFHIGSSVKCNNRCKRTEVTAEFQRLNVLLLRAGTGRRIGTALLTDARVQATLGLANTASGSLGGLQIMNLVSVSPIHQRIISIGREPLVEDHLRESAGLHQQMYPQLVEEESKHAFTFCIVQRQSGRNKTLEGDVGTPLFESARWSLPSLEQVDSQDTIAVSVQMSSVVYTHSSTFLEELNSCAADFKRCMANLAQSITAAATDLALGIVQRRSETFMSGGREGTPGRSVLQDSITSHYPVPAPTPHLPTTKRFDVNLELDVLLETPVLVFPRNEGSLEVLVAHLGQITVSNQVLNSWQAGDDKSLPPGTSRVDRYNIHVHHINLNSLNLESKLKKKNINNLEKQIHFMTAQSLYDSSKFGVPILHDTNLEFCVDRITRGNILRETESFSSGFYFEHESSVFETLEESRIDLMQVRGKVINPLKVSLSRNQYQQLLDTLKSPPENQNHVSKTKESPEKPKHSGDNSSKKAIPVEGSFELPVFSLELRRDAINVNIEPGIVSLTFTEFAVSFDKHDPDTSNVQMALKGLIMEDLLLDENSSHRNLMLSSACPPLLKRKSKPFSTLSTSCPDLLNHQSKELLSKSLPEKLDTKTVFGISNNLQDLQETKRNPQTRQDRNKQPSTPPPSICTSPLPTEMLKKDLKSEENLVHLAILTVDPTCPDFETGFGSTDKFVNVDFNSLDINFNLQTWVVILDFFGIGSDDPGGNTSTQSTVVKAGQRVTEIDIQVKSLSVCFNRAEKDLFKATVLNYTSKIILKDGNFGIEGQLGNFCIKDLTNYGILYRDRFLCRGEQILNFKIFKYGAQDEELTREFDILVDLKMAAITYVHTQRFFSLLMDFFTQFQQLQETMNSFRVSSQHRNHGVGFKPPEHGTGRGSRIKLDVEASSPLLVLPMSSSSTHVLMVDLGFLEIHNSFQFAGDEGTISAGKLSTVRSGELGGRRSRAQSGSRSSQRSRSSARSMDRVSRRSARSTGRGMSSDEDFNIPPIQIVPSHKCLLDVMHISLKAMDLSGAERLSAFTSEEEREDSDVGVGSCFLRKQVKPLLKDKCELKLQIERNLDKGFSHTVPDLSIKGLLSKVHAVIDVEQYKLIQGFLAFNLGEQMDNPNEEVDLIGQSPPTDTEVLWTTTFMDIELQNVTVDLVEHHQILPDLREAGLARINFIKSRLVYESFCDFSKDVDLVSQEILLLDTRYTDLPANKRANVFTCILQPMKVEERNSILQAEIHFRATKDVNRFTILLNNMRLMCILDWWLTVFSFISKDTDNPRPVQPDSCQEKKEVAKMIDFTEEPLYPTAGVVTRRNPVIQTSGPVFELKLNITDSEVVVVADTAQWESSAVILRSTTVLAFRPAWKERPLSCNLNNAEVFSCVLGKEEETALSIIDPVTINLEIWGRGEVVPPSKGLLDVTEDKEVERIADIQLQQLNIRLSYHDAIMFRHILNSLPKQAQEALAGSDEGKKDDNVRLEQPANVKSQIDQLASLGFSKQDCMLALQSSSNQLDDAALWLTQNASPKRTPSPSAYKTSDLETFFANTSVSFSSIQLKTSCINLVVIDDCKDADCPLVELSLASLHLKQKYDRCGSLFSTISSSYYNRALSAWEPCIEPWQCGVDWTNNKLGSSGTRHAINIKSMDVVNINITSAMLELYRVVRANWGEDYYDSSKDESLYSIPRTPPAFRRRTPFVPFAIHNTTGCTLMFHTQVVATDNKKLRRTREYSGALQEQEQVKDWKKVENGETIPFMFVNRSKQRHQNTHQHQLHQVIVRVEGWREARPVSVDKVGTFFRNVNALRNSSSLTDFPPARIVFQVNLEGSARKLITLRSALEIENKLPVPVKVRLENTALRVADVKELELQPKEKLPIPILYCWARMTARPIVANSYQWNFSDKQIHWCHIMDSSDNSLELHESHHAVNKKSQPYRFCVAVRRLGYPQEALAIGPGSKAWVQPAHLITVLPPVTLINLLPCQLQYSLQGTADNGEVKPGSETPLLIDISTLYVLDFYLESFPGVGSLIMQPGTCAFEARIKLSDNRSRPLFLNIKVNVRYGGSVFITVFSPYWIVNKTGLPMLFKEEGDKIESAGQYEEHELARMMAPLLFSFPERDSNLRLVARVGIGLNPEGKPKWCKHFYVQSGCTVRRLRVQPPSHDKRPEWVYIVGIDVRPGKGRYRLTTIITFSPRFQLYNQSSHKIQFSQHCFASSFQDPGAEKTYLTAHTNSSLAFHWPRLDMDQLLCMRLLDIPGSQWSGGFLIESVDSFQLSTRDHHGRARFLRVEISLYFSTFCVVISSADNFPPPFRVDNFSEVPITFYQTGLSDHLLRALVKPHQSVPYALDGPVLPPHITVSAPGGSVATYNMNVTGAGSELTYENFIYIAMTGTFRYGWGESDPGEGVELVLDVPEGSRVVLCKKSGAKRSQLWRMTSTGMLQHEGSSPPQDPKSKKAPDHSHTLVLDIAGPAVQPDDFVPLMLRKPDPRRSLTQRWRFTEDGRLCCQHQGLYVQAMDGYLGISAGRDVVLGPSANLCLSRTESGVPVEQALSRQRLRPGSGFLGVRVTTDGPTRVLQINDMKQTREKSFAKADEPDWLETKKPWLVTHEGGAGIKRKESNAPLSNLGELQVVLLLKGGLGISLVNKDPGEELVYICLTNIVVDYQSLPTAQLLDGSVQSFQIDNQVADSSIPTVLYLSPSSKSDDGRHLPAIHFAINRTPPSTLNPNAEIFRHFILTIKNMTLNIEEELLYKVSRFAKLVSKESEQEEVEDNTGWEHQLSAMAASTQLTRYYFGTLKLTLNQIKLSVQKSNTLGADLLEVKRKMGLSLITFEDASIELDPFSKSHPFETLPFLTATIAKHYQDELLSQAVLILGSTDFLGNPLGFLNDVSEGVSGFVSDGNLGGLVKNVTHGAANSAAKVTGSLSYGISRATLDSKYDEKRLMIRKKHSDNSKQHLVAGLKGLGFGVLGGLTSVFTEPIEGAASDGLSGFFTGLGWGVVGTLTKPAIGVLDLATGAASAVRDSSKSAHRSAPARVRSPRVIQGPGGTLPRYSEKEAVGQGWLYKINGRRFEELYVGFEQMTCDLMIVISSERVVVFGLVAGREKAVLTVGYTDLELARVVCQQGELGSSFHLEIVMRSEGREGLAAPPSIQRPQVRCDSQLVAESVSHTINYAKSQWEETRLTLPSEKEVE